MTRFFICLIITTGVFVSAAFLALEAEIISKLPSFFYQTLLLVFFGTGLVFVYLFRANKSDFFTQLYLLTTMIKILAYGAYSFLMILEDTPGALGNVIWFFVLYGTFTMVEIFFLHRKIFKG